MQLIKSMDDSIKKVKLKEKSFSLNKNNFQKKPLMRSTIQNTHNQHLSLSVQTSSVDHLTLIKEKKINHTQIDNHHSSNDLKVNPNTTKIIKKTGRTKTIDLKKNNHVKSKKKIQSLIKKKKSSSENEKNKSDEEAKLPHKKKHLKKNKQKNLNKENVQTKKLHKNLSISGQDNYKDENVSINQNDEFSENHIENLNKNSTQPNEQTSVLISTPIHSVENNKENDIHDQKKLKKNKATIPQSNSNNQKSKKVVNKIQGQNVKKIYDQKKVNDKLKKPSANSSLSKQSQTMTENSAVNNVLKNKVHANTNSIGKEKIITIDDNQLINEIETLLCSFLVDISSHKKFKNQLLFSRLNKLFDESSPSKEVLSFIQSFGGLYKFCCHSKKIAVNKNQISIHKNVLLSMIPSDKAKNVSLKQSKRSKTGQKKHQNIDSSHKQNNPFVLDDVKNLVISLTENKIMGVHIKLLLKVLKKSGHRDKILHKLELFLAQYPQIFRIDNDYVSIKQNIDINSQSDSIPKTDFIIPPEIKNQHVSSQPLSTTIDDYSSMNPKDSRQDKEKKKSICKIEGLHDEANTIPSVADPIFVKNKDGMILLKRDIDQEKPNRLKYLPADIMAMFSKKEYDESKNMLKTVKKYTGSSSFGLNPDDIKDDMKSIYKNPSPIQSVDQYDNEISDLNKISISSIPFTQKPDNIQGHIDHTTDQPLGTQTESSNGFSLKLDKTEDHNNLTITNPLPNQSLNGYINQLKKMVVSINLNPSTERSDTIKNCTDSSTTNKLPSQSLIESGNKFENLKKPTNSNTFSQKKEIVEQNKYDSINDSHPSSYQSLNKSDNLLNNFKKTDKSELSVPHSPKTSLLADPTNSSKGFYKESIQFKDSQSMNLRSHSHDQRTFNNKVDGLNFFKSNIPLKMKASSLFSSKQMSRVDSLQNPVTHSWVSIVSSQKDATKFDPSYQKRTPLSMTSIKFGQKRPSI